MQLCQVQQQQQYGFRTWVAVLLGHELLGDAEEAAVSLAAWLLQVHATLGLNPVEQNGLGEQQGACAVHGYK